MLRQAIEKSLELDTLLSLPSFWRQTSIMVIAQYVCSKQQKYLTYVPHTDYNTSVWASDRG
jgi:hypothetical protein